MDHVIPPVSKTVEDTNLPVSGKAITEFNTYSTTEKIIGKWIDGSSIYRTTVVYSNVPKTAIDANNSYTLPFTFKKIIKIDSVFNESKYNTFEFGNTYTDTGNFYQYFIYNQSICIKNAQILTTATFTFDYIK